MRRRHWIIAAVCLVLAGPAGAEDRPQISAQAYQALNPSDAIAVEPRDDSDANLKLRDLIVARLGSRGHPTSAGAALQLRFSSEWLTSAPQRGDAIRGDVTNATDHQPYGATNLDYSEADRFFGGPRDRRPGPIQNSFRLRATLTHRNGQIFWQGSATGTLVDRNEQRLAAELAEALAESVGRTLEGPIGPGGIRPGSHRRPAGPAADPQVAAAR